VRGITGRHRDPDRASDDLTGVLARIAEPDERGRAERQRLLRGLGSTVAASARAAGTAALASGRWLADTLVEAAPSVPVRDERTLRAAYPGKRGDDLAGALISTASKATSGVGAAGGALASAEFAAPPLLLSAPVQLAAETLAVSVIELKLVAELHEVYGRSPAGTPAERARVYLTSWVRRRGFDPRGDPGVSSVISGAARRELRQRLLHRAGRNATTFAPLLAGAVAGAELNRRETRKLGEAIAHQLRESGRRRRLGEVSADLSGRGRRGSRG
jgi:hypothetical protein